MNYVSSILNNARFDFREVQCHIGNPVSEKEELMDEPKIFTKDGNLYQRDPNYENPLDSVVQHMIASGFSKKRIKEMIGVSYKFINEAITPHE